MKPRAGSRKAIIYDRFHETGKDAAIKLGVELKLALSTVNSWIGVWSKGEVASPTKKATTSSNKVYHRGDPDRLGIVITAGEQVSQVRWDDDGRLSYVNNAKLMTVK